MSPHENVKTQSIALSNASIAYAELRGRDETERQLAWSKLCQVAEEFAKARWAVKAPPKTDKLSGHLMPFGNSKGQPIEKLTDKDLRYLATALATSIEDPSKERWATKNRQLLDAVEAELATR